MNKSTNEVQLGGKNSLLFAISLFLIAIASAIGFFSNGLYQNNLPDLLIKSKYYDLSILSMAVPIGIVVFILSIKKNLHAILISMGLTVYFVFSYTVILFSCKQNNLFLIYIAILVSCGFYLIKQCTAISSIKIELRRQDAKWTVIVLLFSAISGMAYWIVDALLHWFLPISEQNVAVKAPQVLDMAFVLPITIYGAMQLWKGKMHGTIISLAMMIFFIFIGISVLIMELAYAAQTATEMDHGKIYSYAVISILNIIASIYAYKNASFQ